MDITADGYLQFAEPEERKRCGSEVVVTGTNEAAAGAFRMNRLAIRKLGSRVDESVSVKEAVMNRTGMQVAGPRERGQSAEGSQETGLRNRAMFVTHSRHNPAWRPNSHPDKRKEQEKNETEKHGEGLDQSKVRRVETKRERIQIFTPRYMGVESRVSEE